MAKLKAPLMSLGAAGQLGKSLVFFGWKGLDVVREYVIPSNPKTQLQKNQRAYLTEAVARIHEEQATATEKLDAEDVTAYALWASVVQPATTWFNQAVKEQIDRLVAGLKALICRGGAFSAITATGFDFNIYSTRFSAGGCVTGEFKWGTSKTALINTKTATVILAQKNMAATWTGLTTKTKYYVQFRGLTGADYLGVRSGIYHVTTT